jgi:hypothetical protein
MAMTILVLLITLTMEPTSSGTDSGTVHNEPANEYGVRRSCRRFHG